MTTDTADAMTKAMNAGRIDAGPQPPYIPKNESWHHQPDRPIKLGHLYTRSLLIGAFMFTYHRMPAEPSTAGLVISADKAEIITWQYVPERERDAIQFARP